MKKRSQFSLVYLLGAVTLVALLLGDIARGLHHRGRQEAALNEIAPRADYSVGYQDRALLFFPFARWKAFRTPERLSLYQMPPAELLEKHLLTLSDLECLECNGPISLGVSRSVGANWMTDAHLNVIEQLPRLRTINIFAANITDEGLSSFHQNGNHELQWLSISDCPDLSSDGLKGLDRFSQLKEIILIGLDLDDDAIEHLVDLPNIQTIKIWSCNVSLEATQQVKESYGAHVTISWSEYSHESQEELRWKGQRSVEN